MKKLIALFFALMLAVATFAAVNVNTANEKELKALPGIGKVSAKAIVAEREANGAFTDYKDLSKRVKGVGKKTVEKLKEAGVTFADDAAAADSKK